MAYNVSFGPSQALASTGPGSNVAIDFSSTYLLQDGAVPFFMTVHNEDGGVIYIVRSGETTSGYSLHPHETLTAGPFLRENVDGILEIHFAAASGDALITFTEVLQEN
jgi:hypothetical protein